MVRALSVLLLATAPAFAQKPAPMDSLPAAFESARQELESRRLAAFEASWELEVPEPRFDALSLGPLDPGPQPYPLFGGGDLKLVQKALADAQAAARRLPACDRALEAHGAPSLLALLDRYVLAGPTAQLFDGRRSTLKPAGWRKTVAQRFADRGNEAGAFVLWGGGLPTVTFLGPYFFNPTSMDRVSAQRMIIVAHEAVHQFAGLGDAHFGGSKKLTRLIVDKCYPGGRGRLGGVD